MYRLSDHECMRVRRQPKHDASADGMLMPCDDCEWFELGDGHACVHIWVSFVVDVDYAMHSSVRGKAKAFTRIPCPNGYPFDGFYF